jgi:serine/threonine protein kinase
MYERGFLYRNVAGVSNNFSASTDLWSIGATLFHVATGMLPFRIDRNRSDPNTWLTMTTKKQRGVISAYQLKRDGPIIEETNLPESCLLTSSLKELICPLLGNLVESDPNARLTYSSFFSHVDSIISRKKIHVFFVNRPEITRIYLEPGSAVKDLQNSLEKFTKVSVANQILLFKDGILNEFIEDRLPDTTEDDPIFLMDSSDFEVHFDVRSHLDVKSFPNVLDIEKDIVTAKYNCSVAHSLERNITSVTRQFRLIQSFIPMLNQVIVKQLITVSKENQQISTTLQSLSNQLDMMQELSKICKSFLGLVPSKLIVQNSLQNFPADLEKSYKEVSKDFQVLKRKLETFQPAINSLLERRVEKNQLLEEWRNGYATVPVSRDFLYCI